jgi:hypothetical protein
VVNLIYDKRFAHETNAVLGFVPATALLAQQYVASMSIASFCAAYAYMNAGLSFNSGNARCSDFGNSYVPSTSFFKDSVMAMVDGTFGIAPSSVHGLSNNLQLFASIVQSNPFALGQTKGSYSVAQVKSFSLSFLPSDDATTGLYYGNLFDGSIRFSLTPSSLLLLKNKYPFQISDANPRVVNVQAYWRGVTSASGGVMMTSTNVLPPFLLYEDKTGVGTAYQLPSFQTPSTPHFASSEGIQVEKTAGCSTGSKPVTLKWPDDSGTKICTSNSDIYQPFPGLADSAFLFPSLWASWEVTAAPGLWNRTQFMKNQESLGLQVVFQFIASTTASSKSLQECLFSCLDYTVKSHGDVSPLLGQAWCTERNCNDCHALYNPNGTNDFCRCNVWDGKAEACKFSPGRTSVATPSSFTIIGRSLVVFSIAICLQFV